MDYPIEFNEVSFSYPLDPEDSEETAPLFSDLTLSLPGGFVFTLGPNGVGKSTLMLLASARLFPQAGEIRIFGAPTSEFVDAALDPDLEERRNSLVSFVYQNMEFETEFSIGEVLELVARNSVDPAAAARRHRDILLVADLQNRQSARMQELSKGEMQRAIVAISVLYGSPIVMMDEPVFAVEPHRAEALFEYLRDLCSRGELTIYASVHDIDLARKYGDAAVLMHTDRLIETGSVGELLQRDRLETAFKAPWDTLYRRQALYRDFLNGTAQGEE